MMRNIEANQIEEDGLVSNLILKIFFVKIKIPGNLFETILPV